MADEPDNHTLRLPQEMRGDIRESRAETAAFHEEMNGRFDGVDERVNQLSTRVDGNAMILNMIAGRVHDHEERIVRIEKP